MTLKVTSERKSKKENQVTFTFSAKNTIQIACKLKAGRLCIPIHNNHYSEFKLKIRIIHCFDLQVRKIDISEH